MNLCDIKLNFIRDNNSKAISIIQKIQNISKQKKTTYNKVITYLLSVVSDSYQKRILNICRSIYPYDGQIDINFFIAYNDDNKSLFLNDDTDKEVIYGTGKFSQASTVHIQEDTNNLFENTKYISNLYDKQDANSSKPNVELINTETQLQQKTEQPKKVIRRRKKRID